MDDASDLLEQLEQHLMSASQAWLFGAGISKNAGVPLMDFGQLAPHTRRVTPLDQQMLAMLLSQAARISTHLGAVPTGSPLTQAAVLQCRDDLAVIRTVVMQALRREP